MDTCTEKRPLLDHSYVSFNNHGENSDVYENASSLCLSSSISHTNSTFDGGNTTGYKSLNISAIINPNGSPIYKAIFNMLAGCGIVGLPFTY